MRRCSCLLRQSHHDWSLDSLLNFERKCEELVVFSTTCLLIVYLYVNIDSRSSWYVLSFLQPAGFDCTYWICRKLFPPEGAFILLHFPSEFFLWPTVVFFCLKSATWTSSGLLNTQFDCGRNPHKTWQNLSDISITFVLEKVFRQTCFIQELQQLIFYDQDWQLFYSFFSKLQKNLLNLRIHQ